MNELYVIGTSQLESAIIGIVELLNSFSPSQLFIEMTDDDVKTVDINHYEPDFIAAYNWARYNNVLIRGIDHSVSYFLDNIPFEAFLKIEELKNSFLDTDFKELNKRKYDEMYNNIISTFFNVEKYAERIEGMINNIRENMIYGAKSVALIGVGNLPYFEKNLPEAVFPFRD